MSIGLSAMDMAELPRVISAPRFGTYLAATSNDVARTLSLYQWSFEVSAAFFVPLHLC